MKHLRPDQELEQLDRKQKWLGIIDAPGVIALGIWTFAKFSEDPGSLHPIFEDSSFQTALLLFGGVVVGWSTFQLVAIFRRRSELYRQLRK